MNQRPIRELRSGVTFIELLVVLFVNMGILFFMVMMSYAAAQNAQCKNNLKSLGMAIKIAESQNLCLPPMFENRRIPSDADSYTQVSFFYQLLPFIEGDTLLNGRYAPAATTRIDIYLCPQDFTTVRAPGNVAYSNYAANFAVFRGRIDPTNPTANNKINTKQAMPGCSNSCIVVGERLQNCNGTATVWSSYGPSSYFHVVYTDKTSGFPNQPAPLGMQFQTGITTSRCQPYSTPNGPDDAGSPTNRPSGTTFQSAHSRSFNVLLGDGQVKEIHNGFDPKSLNYYCVGQGRDVWSGPFLALP